MLESLLELLFPLSILLNKPASGTDATSWATVLVWLLCLVVFFWALSAILWSFWPFSKTKLGKKQLTSQLEKLNSLLSLIENNPTGQVDLDSLQERVNLDSSPVIARLWDEYESTLLRVPDGEGRIHIYSTVFAEDIFNKERIFQEIKADMRLSSVGPSVLTGLGILGTFLGLTLGLANIDLTSDSLEKLKLSLRTLLAGAKTAFLTSVWGISLSILLTFLQKKYASEVDEELGYLCQRIDRLFARKPIELWLSDICHEAMEQTKQLKTFNDELAFSIASALDEKLAARLTPALENLLNAIDRLTETGSNELGKIISKEAGKEISKFGEIIENASSVLSQVAEKSAALQKSVGETVSQHLNAAVSQVEGSMMQASDCFRELTGLVNSTVEQVRSSLMEHIAWQREQFEGVLGRVNEDARGYMDDFLKNIDHMLSNVSSNSSSIVLDMGNKIEKLLEELSNHVRETGKEYSSRISEMRSALVEFTSLTDLLKNLMGEASKVLIGYKESAEPVRNAGLTLAEAVKNYEKASHNLQQSTADFKQLWGEYREYSKLAVTEIKQALQYTESAWRAYENQFGKLRGELEKVFDSLKNGLSDYNNFVSEKIAAYLSEIDGEMSRAIRSLGAGVTELRETLDDVAATFEGLKQKELM